MTTNRKKREPRPAAPSGVRVIKHPAGHSQLLGYARVSKKSQSLDTQLAILQEAGCCRVYAEQVSGAAAKRPAFNALLEAVRKGDTVVVAALDRLGRRMGQVLTTLDTWGTEGVYFLELRTGLNSRSPEGRAFLPWLAALAETERNMCRERILEGLRKGEKGGRPPVITPERITLACQLDAKGYSARKIAKAMKLGATTVRKMLALRDETEDPQQLRLVD